MKDLKKPNQALGAAIRDLRTALKLTQRELADELGFKGGEAHVSNLEHGAYGVDQRKVAILLRMARNLDAQTTEPRFEAALVEGLAQSTSNLALLFRVADTSGTRTQVVTGLIAEVA